jgi:hypothetical protein
MRHLVTALLLLAAIAVEGQYVSPTEHAYGKTAGDYVLAAGRNGALLAWREFDFSTSQTRIELARADANGRLLGNSTIPDGEYPNVAGDGESFLLAYIHGSELIAAPVDETGKPGPARIVGTRFAPMPLAATKAGYLLWTDSERLTLDRNATVVARTDDRSIGRAVAATGEARLMYSSFGFPGGYHCGFVRCYSNLPAWYDVYWRSEGTAVTNGNERRNWYTAGSPAAAGIGREFLVLWVGPNGIEGVFLRDGSQYTSLTVPALGDFGSTPDVASDGKRYMAVFEHLGNIQGVLLTPDGGAQPFVVSAAPHTESRPKVQALGEGRFLVTYVREETLLGRVVTVEPGRRRAIGR